MADQWNVIPISNETTFCFQPGKASSYAEPDAVVAGRQDTDGENAEEGQTAGQA
jgi:hypothetical protein